MQWLWPSFPLQGCAAAIWLADDGWRCGGSGPQLDQEIKEEWLVRLSQLSLLVKASFGDFHRRNFNIIENLQLGDG